MSGKIPASNTTKNPPIYPPHQPETATTVPNKSPNAASNTNKQPTKPVGTGTASFANSNSGAFDTEYYDR